jgi:hypothetical protein
MKWIAPQALSQVMGQAGGQMSAALIPGLSFLLDFGQVGWQIQGVVGHDRW